MVRGLRQGTGSPGMWSRGASAAACVAALLVALSAAQAAAPLRAPAWPAQLSAPNVSAERRLRRYVRFPAGRYGARPQPQPPPSAYLPEHAPWLPLRPSPQRERSPRLVFRDPDAPGTLPAFYPQHNGLSSPADDPREYRKQPYPFAGDQSMCSQGTCEFFLTCWMSAGLLEGSCGGFLYACCQRRPPSTAKKSEHSLAPLPDYGPVLNDPRCGLSSGKLGQLVGAQRRIVGGDEAGFGSFPWQAYIRIGSSRCGGSLVNRYHVVTAGHCVARASARQVQVTLGDYVINSAVEPLPAYTFGVREIRVHPYFKFTPQADRFDVAVLRLDRPAPYLPHIAPICLPEKGEDFLGQYGWAAGWGALQAGSRLRPKTLQAVDVPVIDNRLCERWHKSNGINVVIYDEMMCAGYRGGGKDSCQGDSGGPLMLEKAGRWYLIGIVSAGYSCAQRGQPGIYHRVAETVDWISYIINS
ncbi:proclotting enzyme isoform X2 [Schistocerca gregaria]|uniref:proclotting enzyme isoform X2 n=1 Tax=Schistocerca gregaria TaxID=7010 RepID=UPI00211F0403|nr:proclotting enzyme isoform X2 [Schistocerca gregaria]